MASRVANSDGRKASGLGGRLLGGTGLTAPSGSDPFATFGVLAAGKVAPMRRAKPAGEFSASDARTRIADFLSGSYKPGSLPDLVEYLAQRFLRLESRQQGNGQFTNYLVDMSGKVALLAAAVDRRLSSKGIAQMFGRTLDAESQVRRRRIQDSPEMVDARMLRGELAAVFHREGLVPDEDWASFEITMSAMSRGRVVTAQGGEVIVGFEAGLASEDPQENLRLMRRLQAEGRRCFYPAATAEDARAGKLVPGMPIVLRDGAVRTRMIDGNRLSMQALSRKFGQSYFDYYASRPRREAAAENEAGPSRSNVLDIGMFRRGTPAPTVARVTGSLAAPAVEAPRQAAAAAGRGDSSTSRFVVKHELERGGGERLQVLDRQNGQIKDLGDTDLQAGRYQKVDVFGMPDGWLVVDAEGGYVHRDLEMGYHNPYGPAVVPPEGSGGRMRYAIRNEFMSAQEFESRHSAPVSRMATRPQRRGPEPVPHEDDEPRALRMKG